MADKKPWTKRQLEALLSLNLKVHSEKEPELIEKAKTALRKLLADHGCSENDLNDLIRQAMEYQANTADPHAPSASAIVVAPDPPPKKATNEQIFLWTVQQFQKYVYFQSSHHYTAASLWTIHTHVFRVFKHTPRLFLCSEIEGEGKTTVEDILEGLVAMPRKRDSISAASIMRDANLHPIPTFILDEGDNLDVWNNPQIRQMINSGYKRGAKREIVVNGKPVTYNLHAPMALGCIELMPGPIMRRSIRIDMVRATPAQLAQLAFFDETDAEQNKERALVKANIVTWAYENRDKLNPNPDLPRELASSPRDAWRSLVSIADALSPEIGQLAREAALAMSGWGDNPKVYLLGHIREISKKPVDELVRPDKNPNAHLCNSPTQIASASLVANLIAHHPIWAAWDGVDHKQLPRPLTQNILAGLLKRWVRHETIWPSPRTDTSKSAMGYKYEKFQKWWERYCPDWTDDDADEEETAAPSQPLASLKELPKPEPEPQPEPTPEPKPRERLMRPKKPAPKRTAPKRREPEQTETRQINGRTIPVERKRLRREHK
jgi:Protein of unknown function (DUF3631)